MGKFHCARYHGPEPEHGGLIPPDLQQPGAWSPNAGVMRLDPRATLRQRQAEVEGMVADIMQRQHATFLPEQYYLAERLPNWRHINKCWNWEVWPEWDDPGTTHPVPQACTAAQRQGWAGYYLGSRPDSLPSATDVLEEVRVWHFSGSWDTAPWMFQDLPNAQALRSAAALLFHSRDPGGVVATALSEWRSALDDLLADPSEVLAPLHEAAAALAERAVATRARAWSCELCDQQRMRVRELGDVPWGGAYCSGKWNGLRWACSDCIVAQLRAADFQECSCAAPWCDDNSEM